MLPQDGHVHTEWSWDAVAGSMAASCARAVELGLPSIAFTDHAEFTPWVLPPQITLTELPEHFRRWLGPDGTLRPPDLDVAGYAECVKRCRDRFTGLRILSGVELSEPHWHGDRVDALLSAADFDRVLGSVHSVRAAQGTEIVDLRYDTVPPEQVVREYLAEALALAGSSAPFAVLAHLDYPIRAWPESAGRYRPEVFEEEHRAVLRTLAGSGRALEVNTRVPLHGQVVRWWYEAGGEAVVFGSDAHDPGALARGFAGAAAMAEAQGFRPGRDPHDFWLRAS
jgi:histidinol-phosphatase (PHP family)